MAESRQSGSLLDRRRYKVRLRTQLQFAIVEKRRGRQCPRVVKALPKHYIVKFLKNNFD